MFKITRRKGFHMGFENGNVVSVQFGYSDYCDNYDTLVNLNNDVSSKNAEIAIWDGDGEWITRAVFKSMFNEDLNNDVVGYLPTDKVASIIFFVAQMKGDEI